MSEQDDNRKPPSSRWIWRILYIVTPAIAGVPFVVFAQYNHVPLPVYFVLPVSVLYFTLRLAFKRRDFLFLVWGAPLAFALLGLTLYTGCDCGWIAGGMCNGIVMLWAVGPTFVVLVLGFLVGLVGFNAGLCSHAVQEDSEPSDNDGSSTEDSSPFHSD